MLIRTLVWSFEDQSYSIRFVHITTRAGGFLDKVPAILTAPMQTQCRAHACHPLMPNVYHVYDLACFH
jgi:hypothetical protein